MLSHFFPKMAPTPSFHWSIRLVQHCAAVSATTELSYYFISLCCLLD